MLIQDTIAGIAAGRPVDFPFRMAAGRPGLEGFYRDVRMRAEGVTTAAGKQQIIAELYERFLKLALPDTAARLGIVYTPPPVVDYIIRSVADALQAEFGASISDEGVHIIEPFVGTGTFITRLIQSGLIDDADLPRKYAGELHANDIMLLAYYIAAVNIEATYHDRAGVDEYKPFGCIVLTDTFQSYEPGAPMDAILFPGNNERIARQKALDIRVVIGNPPWSATNNRNYPHIDGQVQATYAAPSNTRHLSALYDPYVKAFRLASNWVRQSDKGGIVAFVTNGGFIESNAFDGFRKALAAEFHAIYCYNLRGDARTSGGKRQREGVGVFDAGSRAGVAILLLVKKPGASPGATIHYRDIGDYLSRADKLALLDGGRLSTTDWQVITPNAAGDWIGQRSDAFQTMRPLAASDGDANDSGLAPIFDLKIPGVNTAQDAWCYNFSQDSLISNITGNGKAIAKSHSVDANNVQMAAYWPFVKQALYYHRDVIARPSYFAQAFPAKAAANFGIAASLPGSSAAFHTLAANSIPDLHLAGDTVYFPRWRYVPAQVLTRSSAALLGDVRLRQEPAR